jgi:hypothetical protein
MNKFVTEWLQPLMYGLGFGVVVALLLFWGIK